MEINKLSNFTKGWFIGDFEPSLFPNKDVEVAVKYYKAGDVETAHHHKVAVEYTLIVKGKVTMNNTLINEGEIVTIAPNETTDFKVLEDTITVVVKLPSVKDDKYLDQ
jgi:mannose-6-phosphate isomerase-like protein (cupin superfamily)